MFSYSHIFKIGKMFIGDDDLYPDKTEFDLIELDELDDESWNYTLLNCPTSEFIYSNTDIDFTKCYEPPLSPKSQIRHHDCMWSGRCTTHPEKLQCSNVVKTKPEQTARKATQHNDTHQQQHHQQHYQSQSQQTQQTTQTKKIHQESIPAGQSLLINSRLNQPKPAIIKVPSVSTNDFLKDREYIARPDTPLSLDDDPPEFKHTTDVSACTMGSNRMSLVSDTETPTEIINLLKEHLEDTSLQVKNSKLHSLLPGGKADSLSDFLKDIKTLSDYEDLDGEDSVEENESDSDSHGNAASGVSSYDYSQTTHSDHSYTRSKNRVDVIGLGVQTPSDSEEEIDVVSVGEKALPTNPTAKDRRALQTTVAHKISNRIVKTSSGVRTIPPRRRYSAESENSATATPSKSFSSLSHSFVKYGDASSSSTVPSNRKRPHSAGRDDRSSNNKRHRGKKQHHHPQHIQQTQHQQQQPTQHRSPVKRSTSDTDETETIEKRNLHNNMERQRRIGLKNLFEELKRQIPNLKDKDRAPKVSILREAANLCRRFNKEEDEKNALRKAQAKLYNRVSVLRTSLAAQRSRYLD